MRLGGPGFFGSWGEKTHEETLLPNVSSSGRWRASAVVLVLCSLSRLGDASAQTWTNNGPEGGAIYDIAIDPSNSNTLYTGARAGVFKSTDGAGSWSRVSTGLESSSAVALAIDPSTPAILYAATANRGVFKTVDGGASWSPINEGLIPYVISLAIDPTAPTTLYAGTFNGRVFKTTNGGSTWVEASTGLTTDNYITRFAIDSRNADFCVCDDARLRHL